MQAPSIIPVSIVTGFLGAGKTTLLNRVLKSPELHDTAVIVNEFGDISLDHLLVEQASDGIIELADGCLCCTIRGELIDTLADLVDRMQSGKIKSLKRIIIETTGLADPAPVIQAVIGHPVLMHNFRLDGVITLVDIVNAHSTLDNHEEAVKQIAMADRLVLTKTEMSTSQTIMSVKKRLEALNPAAPKILITDQTSLYEELFNCGLYNPNLKTPDVANWLNEEAYVEDEKAHNHNHNHGHDKNKHDARIRAFTLAHDQPIDPSALEMFIDILRTVHSEQMLRMKGIFCLSSNPERPVVVHGVQSLFSPPAQLKDWPSEDHRSRVVIITKDLKQEFVARLFDTITDKPAIDMPDKQALQNNPLAIAGYKPK